MQDQRPITTHTESIRVITPETTPETDFWDMHMPDQSPALSAQALANLESMAEAYETTARILRDTVNREHARKEVDDVLQPPYPPKRVSEPYVEAPPKGAAA